jgi:hypothetical protein
MTQYENIANFQNNVGLAAFEVLTAVSTKMAVFWVVAPCSLVDYMALLPRRQPSLLVLVYI